jgi:very-short-patch-repair endonuclease
MDAMSFGIDKAAETLAEMLAADMHASMAEPHPGIKSPIEAILYISLTRYCDLFSERHAVGGLVHLDKVSGAEPVANCLCLWHQRFVLDWPIDFVLAVIDDSGQPHWLAVECDGHDFHERTKEQAARDRERDRRLQAHGMQVMRFTGSEIYRDPIKCVTEIIEWAASNVWASA